MRKTNMPCSNNKTETYNKKWCIPDNVLPVTQ